MTPNIDDDFIETVRGLEERLKLLARASRSRYSEEVNSIIGTRSRDIKLIESCLDKLLNMCYDMAILQLFRRLCRYYYYLDTQAATQYVQFYREMWDDDDSPLST